MKYLEIRAKIKSVKKINKIFLCILTYIWKYDIFSTYLNFDEICLFGYLAQEIQLGPSNNLILCISSQQTPCSRYFILTIQL